MATYTKVCTGAAYDTYTLRLVLEETDKSDATNISSVKYWLYLDTSYPRFEDYQCTYKLHMKSSATGWDGYVVNETKQRSMPSTRYESLLLAYGTEPFTHDSDGNATISFTASFECADGAYTAGHATITDSFTLSQLDRAAPTVTQADISAITANSFKISATANEDCDSWDYKIGSGGWVNFSTTRGKSASTTITGLTAGVTYTVTVRARKANNHLYGTSPQKSAMTLGKSVIGTVQPFNLEDVFRVPLTKYVSSATDTLTIKVGSTTIKTITGYTNNADIQLTPAELLVAYEALGATNAATATLTLETSYNGSSLGTSSATATASAAGTATIVNHGRGVVWRNVNGVWHRAIAFVNVAGPWKPGF